jgi:hemoglobin
MKDIDNIQDIYLFVDEFYGKVRQDTLIGPVFIDKITGDWQLHLNKMYAFWNAALFGVAGYKGNPFAMHAPLKIEQEHFERWIDLFTETIDHNFEGSMANDVKNRAGLMADMFLTRLRQMPQGTNKIIV